MLNRRPRRVDKARNEQNGQGLVEYSLVLLFVVVVVVSALAPLGPVLATAFATVTRAFP
jgi:Flp pilus assembly pilin Flp